MTIYIDIIFFENFIMNLSIILSVALLLNSLNNIKRKIIGAIVGSLIGILHFYIEIPGYYQIFVAALIVFISFEINNVKEFFKKIILFYFVSFLFGGISFVLINQLPGKIIIMNNVILKNSNLFLVFLSAFIGYLFLKYILITKKQHVFKDIVIFFEERKVEIRVLLDTGNLLKEPYTNKPVIIVEKDSIKELLSGKDIRFFLIPYKSIGNSSGFLYGIKPEFVLIKESNLKIKNVVIGVCDEKLSNTGDYSGIFGLKTLDEGV